MNFRKSAGALLLACAVGLGGYAITTAGGSTPQGYPSPWAALALKINVSQSLSGIYYASVLLSPSALTMSTAAELEIVHSQRGSVPDSVYINDS